MKSMNITIMKYTHSDKFDLLGKYLLKIFWVSNERYGQINTFLLQCYGTNFASIKRYHQFCILELYIRRHRFFLFLSISLLSFLSILPPSLLYFFSLYSTLYIFSYCLSSIYNNLSLSTFELSLTLKNVRSCSRLKSTTR